MEVKQRLSEGCYDTALLVLHDMVKAKLLELQAPVKEPHFLGYTT
ncbi:hypothetical protein OCB72_29580 [Bacillus cereus]|nr:hypothetical protein [Bacillus cereus]